MWPATRIAFSGTFSVGKSTLCAGLAECLRHRYPDQPVAVIGNISRDLVKAGRVNANKGSSVEHYCLYVAEYLRRLREIDPDTAVVLHDRTLLDVLGYVLANGNAPSEFVEMLTEVAHAYVKSVDLYFYVPIEIPIHADGLRVNDEAYRKLVDAHIRQLLARLPAEPIPVTGSVEERVDLAMTRIEEHLIERRPCYSLPT